MAYVLTLKLKTEIYQEHKINKSFNVAVRIYNSLLSHEIKKLNLLEQDSLYNELRYKKDKTKDDKLKLKSIREKYKLSSFDFNKDIKEIRNHYKENISSQVGQKLAKRLWSSFEKYMFGVGEEIKYKKKNTINSLEGSSNYNGIVFDGVNVSYLDMIIPVIIPNDDYTKESLKRKVCYCRILRKPGKRGYHYYVQLVLDGSAPTKERKSTVGRVGIDIGTSTIAIVSDYNASIDELSKDIKDYGKEIKLINRKIERSKRTLNPNNYNDDKTIKKGKHKWVISNHCKKLYSLRSYLYQKVNNKRKYLYELMSNDILSQGNEIIVETMDFKSLQKRKKETEKNEKGRFKKKKRFGKSIAKHAPSMLINIIERKAPTFNAKIIKVDKFKYRASQYNHITGEYVKHKLNERRFYIGDYECQRDLYSAFLLKCYKNNEEIDGLLCFKEFERFKELHELEIIRLSGQKNISCIGY